MKIIISLFIVFAGVSNAFAQHSDSTLLLAQNQHTDNLVVEKNVDSLVYKYAPDFVFSHGSGKVEGRESWLKSVAKGNFIRRTHDSVKVYLHDHIATVTGKLSVVKKTVKGEDRYHLKYVRVYALRKLRWEMISHITTWEMHEK